MSKTATDSQLEAKAVPLRRQYLQLKDRFPDTILLFRLGDFYETFDSDAEVASKVLDIVLTGRDMGKGKRVPMAGIPHHAAEGYIARLVSAGHKVAICEQVGSIQKGRGLVERDVTRVVTPGTVTDPLSLDGSRNNYIAAFELQGKRAGVAFADITTGQFFCTELERGTESETAQAVERELGRLQPAEVVFREACAGQEPDQIGVSLPDGAVTSRTDRTYWRSDRSRELLMRHFDVASLDGFGCAGKPLATAASGGLLHYLVTTQRSSLKQVASLSTYSLDSFMTLDPPTRANLELIESVRGERRHSLIAVLDQTKTPIGGRLLRQWISQPLLDVDALKDRQDQIELFLNRTLARGELRALLGSIADIERLTSRSVAGNASPRELASLRASLSRFPEINKVLSEIDSRHSLPICEDVRQLLEMSIVDDPPAQLGKGPALRPGFAPELDAHRQRAREAREFIAGLERSEREKTGIRTLKVGYNKVFGYYLEVSTAALANAERDRAKAGLDGSPLPADYLPKQTLANGTRYFTPQLKEYETIVLTAEETTAELEADAYRRVLQQVSSAARTLLEAAQTIAIVDVLCALAEVASLRNYVRPMLDNSDAIEIEAGRHPTLEALLGPGEFVPNDALLNRESNQIVILTGPNMAGKSSWLRQVALIVLLAQTGSFVPAKSARIGIVDRIFTRIGAQDDISSGQSTFMVEMLETASILNNATPKSLVVLDEIGRGTSTYDGLAIARAIVEYIHNSTRLGCKTLFATHYHELTELEQILPRVKNYRMDVHDDGEEVVFLHHVVSGGANRSYGLHVAQLAGIPRGIVRRAQEILSELEGEGHHSVERDRRRSAMRSAPPSSDTIPSFQLTMFGAPDPVLEELKQLDIEALSPLEALTKLFELRRAARGEN